MAAPLRAVSNLKLATTFIVLTGAAAVVVVGAGVSAPIVYNMAQDHVSEVIGLQELYTITYGETLDFTDVQIKLTNSLDSTPKIISGKEFKISGFDEKCISDTQEVTLSYLDYSKKISAVVNPKKLGTPTITFDTNKGILSWEPVAEAKGYTLQLTEPVTERHVTTFETKETFYDFNTIQFYTPFEVAVLANNTEDKGSNGVSAYVSGDLSSKKALAKIPDITNLRFDPTDSKFKWDAIDGVTEYEVTINNITRRPKINELEYDTKNPGTYSVTIRPVGDGVSTFSTSLSIDFRRLPTPVLSFANGSIQTENKEAGIEYYKDGVVFSGNVSDITDAGTYVITAKNIHQNEYEIDSALSQSLSLKKLALPTISVDGGQLKVEGKPEENNVQYYLDGELFNGNLNAITEPGTHVITAKVLGLANQIDSQTSNSVTVRKLEAPTISFDGLTFSITNIDEGFKYQIDGGEPTTNGLVLSGEGDSATISDNLISNLPAGEHTIVARNRGNANDILASRDSNVIRFLIPEIDVMDGTYTDPESGSKMMTLTLTHSMANVNTFDASVYLEWFDEGAAEPFSTSTQSCTVFPKGQSARPLSVAFKRGHEAYYIRWTISFDIDFGTTVVYKNYTKSGVKYN